MPAFMNQYIPCCSIEQSVGEGGNHSARFSKRTKSVFSFDFTWLAESPPKKTAAILEKR